MLKDLYVFMMNPE